VESLARAGVVELLAASGCMAVYIGVESLIRERLIYLNKSRRPDAYLLQLSSQVLPAVLKSTVECYMNLQFGIPGNLHLGIPGETDYDFEETKELLTEWGSEAVSHGKLLTIFPQLHVVYPGTGHFLQGIAQKRFKEDIFERFTAWEMQQEPVLTWLGEHFAHGTGGLPEGILNSKVLAAGNFEVSTDDVLRINTWLTRLGQIPGIKVFKYGEHLTVPTNSTIKRRTYAAV
jgi:hypothetical protein